MIMPILSVKDVVTSLEFYKDTLGFTHTMSMPAPDGSPVFAIVALGEQISIGLTLDNASDNPASGVQFMIYLPDSVDIDQYYAGLKAKGVAMQAELREEYWGDRTFSVLDPNRCLLSFCRTVRQVPVEEMVKAVQERAGEN